MELDDLRGSWQTQTTPIDTVMHSADLPSQPSLIEKMRQNAQWEMAITVIAAFGLPVFIALAALPIQRLYGAVALLLTGIMLFYYYQKLVLLGRMARSTGSVHGHLQRLYEGMRSLLRFYYRLTLATGPVVVLILAGYNVGYELARPGPFRWKFIALLSGEMLLLGGVLQIAVVYGTRWYLQRLYGRHLDHLEASLQELNS